MSHQNSFSTNIRIHFNEADPAGILYFANVFSLSHQVFEEFIVAAGISWNDYFFQKKYLIPIRHAECDYLSPFYPGQEYQVTVQVLTLSESSFKLQYTFHQDHTMHAVVQMVHTYVDASTKKKTHIPNDIKTKLAAFVVSDIA